MTERSPSPYKTAAKASVPDYKASDEEAKERRDEDEGAPKLETPESPGEVPEETSRDEEPETETPEEPKAAAPVEEVARASKNKPAAPVATPTNVALVAALSGGPCLLSPDEAALVVSQHNL